MLRCCRCCWIRACGIHECLYYSRRIWLRRISENRILRLDFGLAAGAQAADADVWKVAVALVIIEPIANDELVGDDEAGIVGFDVGDSSLRLVKQHGHAKMFWLTFLEEPQQIFQGQTGV